MKTFYIFLLSVLFFCMGANAENLYRVKAQGGLNVRAEADVSSIVLGKLQNNDLVSVQEVVGNWAAIDFEGQRAYVASQYLEVCTDMIRAYSSQNHASWLLPFGIFLLAIVCSVLLGREYYKVGIVATAVLLILIWYMFAKTDNPLWFLTEKGVGIGMMLFNMFLAFVSIMLIWSCIAAVMMLFCVDTVTVWGAKALFALTVFAPDNNLILVLLLWGIGLSIYRSIKFSSPKFFVYSCIGLIICGVVVYWGGTLCGQVFHGFDAAILVVGLFPQLLNGIDAFGGSSSDETKTVTVRNNAGHEYHLTQNFKSSEVDYIDQNGNPWTHDSSGYHPS